MIVMNVEKELVKQSKKRGGASRRKTVHNQPLSSTQDDELESFSESVSHNGEASSSAEKVELSPFSQTLRSLFKIMRLLLTWPRH